MKEGNSLVVNPSATATEAVRKSGGSKLCHSILPCPLSKTALLNIDNYNLELSYLKSLGAGFVCLLMQGGGEGDGIIPVFIKVYTPTRQNHNTTIMNVNSCPNEKRKKRRNKRSSSNYLLHILFVIQSLKRFMHI